jgi:ribose-phosphate pyrophosphokinase
MMSNCFLFSGNASQKLAASIANNFVSTIKLGKIEHTKFPSGEWYCQFKENIRGADVFLINSTSTPANDNLMQLLIMADAARRASAGRITAVIPYFGYSRQDRKDKSRVPISAKLVMNILFAAGIQRVVVVDLHAPQIVGFTDFPVDHLYFRPSLMAAVKDKNIGTIVAPDVGAVKKGEEYASRMGWELAVISKRRENETKVEAIHFVGNVQDKNVLVIDDLTESAGTLIEASVQCKTRGAKEVYCAVTHGCFTHIGFERLNKAFEEGIIDRLFVSNSVDFENTMPEHITIVDISFTLAKAIQSVHDNESVSSLFE